MACVLHHENRLQLLDSLPKHGVVAELGVLRGDFSQQIIHRTHPKRLYLVDLFDGVVSSGDQNGENVVQVDMGLMRNNLEMRFGGRPVTTVKANSISWLSEQQPFSLDFVYIDTDHSLDQTLAELVAAKQCVKQDGFICGHDYSPAFPGVIQAVNQFCLSMGLRLEVFDGDKLPSYRIKNLWRDNMHGYWTQLPDMFKS